MNAQLLVICGSDGTACKFQVRPVGAEDKPGTTARTLSATVSYKEVSLDAHEGRRIAEHVYLHGTTAGLFNWSGEGVVPPPLLTEWLEIWRVSCIHARNGLDGYLCWYLILP
jgi:hypothetical protein